MKGPFNIFALCVLLCVCTACVGCVNKTKPTQEAEEAMGISSGSPPLSHPFARQRVPARLQPAYDKLIRGGSRHAVLNFMHLGLDAMQLGDYELAKLCLDEAISRVDTVFALNDNAEKARSLWYSEGQKDFKGEPYERAMLYYYRGLLYLFDNDLENARACFKSCELQDAFAAEAIYRCDFALAMALNGWCALNLGDRDDAQKEFQKVSKLRPDWKRPANDDSLLVVVETGTAPRKLADGIGHSELKFFRGKHFQEKRAQLSLDGGPALNLYPMEDVAWQAKTRGGRLVDKILAGKAEFRASAANFGSTLTDISNNALVLAPAIDGGTGIFTVVASGATIVGVAAMASAANANPWADVRYWKNLPDTVHLASLRVAPGRHSLQVAYFDENLRPLPKLSGVVEFIQPADRAAGVVWIRSRQIIVQ